MASSGHGQRVEREPVPDHRVAVDQQQDRAALLRFRAASAPFHGGTLCVATPLTRTPTFNTGGNAGPTTARTASYNFNARIQSGRRRARRRNRGRRAVLLRDPADAQTVGLANGSSSRSALIWTDGQAPLTDLSEI